jgi:rSAM/selenodomain-associated transferase 1
MSPASAEPGAGSLLVIFAKSPRPGYVKTRMCPPLTPREAADLYAAMLEDVMHESARAAKEIGLEVLVALDPRSDPGEFINRVSRGFAAVPQRGADLGQRMTSAIDEALARGAAKVMLRGSDNPALGVERIAEVEAGLNEYDLVVSPDLDGGYGMIGLRRPAAGLFDHPMSTGSVLRDTLANARSLGLSVRVTEPSFDLDQYRDLVRLRELPEGVASRRCKRTLACCHERDLWRYLDLR